jgi:hypothetical protein
MGVRTRTECSRGWAGSWTRRTWLRRGQMGTLLALLPTGTTILYFVLKETIVNSECTCTVLEFS